MINLSIRNGSERISFPLSTVTYFHGKNYPLKYEYIKVIRKHFNKTNHSDYDLENNTTTNIYIDNDEINLRNWNYFEIDTKFDFDSQFKLRSKSLMLQYLESVLVNIEYDDTVSTINILFDDLTKVINEKIELGNSEFSIDAKLEELTLKSLLKLIELNIIKEESLATEYNLTYTEYVLTQIRLIKKVAKTNELKNNLVLVQLPYYDETIIDELKCDLENLYFIVVNEDNEIDAKREEVIYFGKQITPLYDDVELYNKIMLEHGVITTLEELNSVVNDFLKNSDNEITKILKENL